MKQIGAFLFCLFLAFAVDAQTTASGIKAFGWLAGCWELKDAKRGLAITEMWTIPDGQTMLGVGRTVKNGIAVDFEFVRIVEDAGGISYIAKPAANAEETAFKLVRSGGGENVFENLGHDFPQRVIYRSVGSEKLHARIEGMRNGKLTGVDFPMVRVSCEAR